jgi:thioredoxin-related protein
MRIQFKILFIVILLLGFSIKAHADWYEVNSFGKVPAVSKIAKIGKVSIFIVSTNWCAPCKALKEIIKAKNYNMNDVDVYIIDMAPVGYRFKQVEEDPSYQTWLSIENLHKWPTVYVTAQTSTLKGFWGKPGGDKTMVAEIDKMVTDLLSRKADVHPELIYTSIITD